MRNELTKSYGDASNSFAFANFFPERIWMPFEKLQDLIYNFMNKTGIFDKVFKPRWSHELPVSGSSDIERIKALKRMDEELDSLIKS